MREYTTKKGQADRMFLYILMLVIFVLVLLVGYKMIAGFTERSDELILLKFERDLQATLQSITYGTTKIRTFTVPPGYSEFWLADTQNAFVGNSLKPSCNGPPEIVDALESKTENNAFLVGDRFFAFKLERVSIGSGCIHAPVKEKEIELRLSKG